MLDEFLVRAALAGLGLALVTGPLGCIVVWRRMAYFGDAIAHASILGVALAIAAGQPLVLGALVVALLVGAATSGLADRGHSLDSSLGVLSHGALAFGLLALSFLPQVRIDPSSLLFGDLLSVGRTDLVVIWGGAVVVLLLIASRWSTILTATLSEEIAQSAGIDPRRERLIVTVALALVVAISLKIVGALLIGAMLLIPASAARGLTRSPESMAFAATAIGAFSALGGLGLSMTADTPTGPSITAAACLFFVGSLGLRARVASR